MIQIFDDLLSYSQVNEMEELVTSVHFPWYLQKATITDRYKYDHEWQNDKTRFADIEWLSHGFIDDDKDNSGYVNLPKFIFNAINDRLSGKYKSILRCQANLVFCDNSGKPTIPHIDSTKPHDVILYYVNESDGDSIFYDEIGNVANTVSPKKGRVVIFNGGLIHSGTPPKTSNKRILFNYNVN